MAGVLAIVLTVSGVLPVMAENIPGEYSSDTVEQRQAETFYDQGFGYQIQEDGTACVVGIRDDV